MMDYNSYLVEQEAFLVAYLGAFLWEAYQEELLQDHNDKILVIQVVLVKTISYDSLILRWDGHKIIPGGRIWGGAATEGAAVLEGAIIWGEGPPTPNERKI